MAGEGRSLRGHDLAMNETSGRIAGEGVPFVFGGQCVAAIDLHAARGRELMVVCERGRPRPTDRVELRVFRERRHIMNGLLHCEERVSFDEVILQNDVLNRIAVRADETIAVVIEAQTKLPVSRDRSVLTRERVEAEVEPGERQRLALRFPFGLHGGDRSATQTVRHIDPAIRTERRMVRAQL